MSDAVKAYRKFCKAHGGEVNAVRIDGRTIFPDGAEVWTDGGFPVFIDHEPNRYAGESGRVHAARAKAANVVLHRLTLYEAAVEEFEELKRRLKGSCDRAGLRRLEALKEEVQAARKEVRKAERAAERVEPDYVPPSERRREDAEDAKEAVRVAEFDAALSAIRL